ERLLSRPEAGVRLFRAGRQLRIRLYVKHAGGIRRPRELQVDGLGVLAARAGLRDGMQRAFRRSSTGQSFSHPSRACWTAAWIAGSEQRAARAAPGCGNSYDDPMDPGGTPWRTTSCRYPIQVKPGLHWSITHKTDRKR